jgi:hypothetical protein
MAQRVVRNIETQGVSVRRNLVYLPFYGNEDLLRLLAGRLSHPNPIALERREYRHGHK